MTFNGRSVPIGKIATTLSIRSDAKEPYSELNLVSDSDDESLGGVALNCISLRGVASSEDLSGLSVLLDHTDSQTELAESVFWTEGIETLEIESLSIEFGPMHENTVPIKVQAECFDHTGPVGQVLIVAAVKVQLE